MDDMEDKIAQSLNLDPLEGEILSTHKPPVVARKEETQLDNDYTYARENFYNVIEKGTEALERMLDVAHASEHPRAYEVVSTIMKTLTDANKDLVKMSTDKKELDEPKDEGPSNSTVNNNLFVGSTAELQSMLKDLRDGDK